MAKNPAAKSVNDANIDQGNEINAVSPAVVVVTAAAGPRRRAGFAFGPEPVTLTEEDLGEKPEAILETLMADPYLSLSKPASKE